MVGSHMMADQDASVRILLHDFLCVLDLQHRDTSVCLQIGT